MIWDGFRMSSRCKIQSNWYSKAKTKPMKLPAGMFGLGRDLRQNGLFELDLWKQYNIWYWNDVIYPYTIIYLYIWIHMYILYIHMWLFCLEDQRHRYAYSRSNNILTNMPTNLHKNSIVVLVDLSFLKHVIPRFTFESSGEFEFGPPSLTWGWPWLEIPWVSSSPFHKNSGYPSKVFHGVLKFQTSNPNHRKPFGKSAWQRTLCQISIWSMYLHNR